MDSMSKGIQAVYDSELITNKRPTSKLIFKVNAQGVY